MPKFKTRNFSNCPLVENVLDEKTTLPLSLRHPFVCLYPYDGIGATFGAGAKSFGV
jgi:hypothetical protein